MKVAKVDSCQKKILGILLEDSKAVGYKESLKNSTSKAFDAQTINSGMKALEELKSIAQKFHPQEYRAVATSAFREASNGEEVIEKFKKILGPQVKIITQEMEAKLGYFAVSATASKDSLVVWDIGGGSMQITTLLDHDDFLIFQGHVASVPFKDKIIAEIQKMEPLKKSSPNPIAKADCPKAVEMAKEAADEINDKLKKILKGPQSFVVGIGGVHYYSIKNQLGSNEKAFNQEDLKRLYAKRCGLSDSQISGKYAQTEISNIALVLGFMQGLGINQVKPMNINMADGILVSSDLF